MFVEAKAYNQSLTNHCPQLARYFNSTPEVTVAAITNGREWRFFTDLVHRNVMDERPFMTLHLDQPADDVAEQLARFHHDQFKPDALRALAEESIFLAAFRDVITEMLNDCDMEFVRFVLTKANVQRTYTQRFLESVQPIVKQAVARSISGMVAKSLSATPTPAEVSPPPAGSATEPDGALIDPTNPKIITTATERRVLEVCEELLQGAQLQGKDNESYYAVLYQGKSNRWILRYWGDKKRPHVQLIVPLTEAQRAEVRRAGLELESNDLIHVARPEHLYRLSGLLSDCLAYCSDDENFRRKTD